MKKDELSDIFLSLGSDLSGLSEEEAKKRALKGGPNTLPSIKGGHWSAKLAAQFTHFFAALLWAAAAISFIAAFLDPASNMLPIGWAILIVIFLNGFFGFYQEFRTEKSLEALRRILPSKATVRRGDALRTISTEEIVSGDIVILKEGDKIPADMYIVDASELWVNESTLTGESEAVSVGVVGSRHHKSVVYSGTFVVKGEGEGLVFAIGKESRYGLIASLTQKVSSGVGHLQIEIGRISRIIAVISFLIAASFVAISLSVGGSSTWSTFLFSLGVLVALIPEGLLPTVTLSLAFGAQRMAAKGFLVNSLSVIENLGAITVIATDKTGTLTQNRMEVADFYEFGIVGEPSGEFTEALVLCSRFSGQSGDEAERAFYNFASSFVEPSQKRADMPLVKEFAFDYHLKRMTTIHRAADGFLAVCKGASEVILGLCANARSGDGVVLLDDAVKKELLLRHDKMAANGYKIIAFAKSNMGQIAASRDEAENNMTFLGFVALIDPLREDIIEAVADCERAGIRVLMITGDHPITAAAIGMKAGIVTSQKEVTTGDKLANLPKSALRRILCKNHVFARVTPEQKLYIVSTLKEMGDIVAVTGDGVNDAPALKKADVGIAMGSGTDVAKQAAAAVLIDDHFVTIVKGVEEGRAVYENIRRFITYMLASNLPEAVPYVVYFLAGVPLALPVALVLAIDLGTDIMPGLSLGVEPLHKGLMDKKPHGAKEPILTPWVYLRAFGFLGIIASVLSMGLFFGYLYAHGWRGGALEWDNPLYLEATTLTFAAIVSAQIGNGLSCRSDKKSIASIGFWSNRYYWWSVLFELAIMLMLIFIPVFSGIFGTLAFEPIYWIGVVFVAPIVFFAEELRKVLVASLSKRSKK